MDFISAVIQGAFTFAVCCIPGYLIIGSPFKTRKF